MSPVFSTKTKADNDAPITRKWGIGDHLPANFEEMYRKEFGVFQEAHQLPIVYAPSHNIKFWGLEKLHPFDAAKFEKISRTLAQKFGLPRCNRRGEYEWAVQPQGPISDDLLLSIHTPQYLKKFERSSAEVARVCEMGALGLVPGFVTRNRVVKPMKTMVSGTVLALGMAVQNGWTIHLGGGMHHSSADGGGGWCAYADWYIALKFLREASGGRIKRALYIDLDAHQGNGPERDKLFQKDDDFVILDIYNVKQYPEDHACKSAIDIKVELEPFSNDDVYLPALDRALQQADALGPYDIVLYNAGSDSLVKDPIGELALSADGLRTRDERVWQFALDRRLPIVMCLSGGYAPGNAAVVGSSIINLVKKFELFGEGRAPAIKGQEEATALATPARVAPESAPAVGASAA